MVPSNRKRTGVDTLLEYSDSLALYPHLSLGQDGGQHERYRRLRRRYGKGSWPAILQVNRQVFDEAHDLMHTRLSFRVDIFTSRQYEEMVFDYHHPAQLHIRSISVDTPTCLVPHLKHLRHLSIKLWFARKVVELPNGVRPYIANSAKSIKDHVNSLVLAMQQSPCLKTIEVELQIIRESRAHHPPNTGRSRWRPALYPAVLDDQEVATTILWYLSSFKLLRNIDMKYRYIAGRSLSHLCCMRNFC